MCIIQPLLITVSNEHQLLFYRIIGKDWKNQHFKFLIEYGWAVTWHTCSHNKVFAVCSEAVGRYEPRHDISNNVVYATSEASVWSELVAWVFNDCYSTNWTPFGISQLSQLVWVYTCQNATFMEITCPGPLWTQTFFLTLIRLYWCLGWSESSLTQSHFAGFLMSRLNCYPV